MFKQGLFGLPHGGSIPPNRVVWPMPKMSLRTKSKQEQNEQAILFVGQLSSGNKALDMTFHQILIGS